MTKAVQLKLGIKVAGLSFASKDGCVGDCSFDSADKAHPNKMPFRGTLLLVDRASDKPPHGADGHRIYVAKAVAQRRLNTLIGMALNYSPDLDGHNTQHKVGIITGAHIEGNKVKVNGFVWEKDFPEAAKDLHSGKLGMSMELADVYVRSRDDDVWRLEDFHFSGATALYKSTAAYFDTALQAAAAALGVDNGGEMAEKNKVKQPAAGSQAQLLTTAIAAGVAPAVKAVFMEGMGELVAGIKAGVKEAMEESNASLVASIDDLRNVVTMTAAADLDLIKARGRKDEEEMDAAHKEEDEEAAKEDDEEAAAKKDEEDEEDNADAEDEDDVDAALETLEDDSADEEPGEVNKDSKNKGSSTAKSDGKPVGKAKQQPLLAAADRRTSSGVLLRKVYASHLKLKDLHAEAERKHRKEIRKLNGKIEAMEAQLEAAAEAVDRRSVIPAELSTVLAKSNVDIRELQAGGVKLTVAEVDEMLGPGALGHQLDVTTRMSIKNQLIQRGWMDQGEVVRQ